MARTQPEQLSPQQPGEAGAANFAGSVQRNLQALFQDAHIHAGKTAAPASNEGKTWDIVPTEINGVAKLYIKYPTLGWLSVTLA